MQQSLLDLHSRTLLATVALTVYRQMALNRQLDDEIKELVRDRMRAWRIRLEYYTTSAEAGERESAQIDAEEPLPNIPRKKDRR